MAQVLVIEDDAHVRQTVRLMLEHLGYSVSEAADGRDALDIDAQQPADVVITDIYMPGMEGVETIQTLLRRRPEARVIAMSGGGAGLAANDSLHMARLLGARTTLTKPFSADQLRRALTQVLGG